MYENQNKDYAFDVFFQSVMSEILYFFSCLHIRKKVEEIRIRFSSFYYRGIANLCNCILNIDQLEMKQALVSEGSIV